VIRHSLLFFVLTLSPARADEPQAAPADHVAQSPNEL
jgi:hypothetical protein